MKVGVAAAEEAVVPFMLKPVAVGALWVTEGLNGCGGGGAPAAALEDLGTKKTEAPRGDTVGKGVSLCPSAMQKVGDRT